MAGFTLVSNQTIIARNAGALYGIEVGNSNMASYISQAGSNMDAFLNTVYTNSVGTISTSTVADVLLTNLGITGNSADPTTAAGIAKNYIISQLNAVAYTARGAVVNSILTAFANLTSDPTFGSFATTWNTKVSNAVTYAAVTGNADTSFTNVSSTPSTAGQTFTLTTGVDNLSGSAITGSVGATGANATDTLNASDVISGIGTSDVLNIIDSATNTDVTNGASINGFETINIKVAAGATGTLNASLTSGATAVNNNAGAGAVTVTNLAAGAAIGVVGNGAVVNGTTSYAYKTATSAQTINIQNGTAGGNITNTAGTGVTTATINSTGADNTVGTIQLDSAGGGTITSLTISAAKALSATLTAADFATTSAVTISGAAATSTDSSTRAITTGVDLGANTTNFKTVDASGLTAGGVKMTLGTGLTSFKGGAGKDIVTTATLTATTAGQVDGGAGTADRLVVAAAANVNTATKGAEFVNFEELDNNTNTDLDLSLISGITSERMTGGAGFTNMTAAQAANIVVPVTNDTFTLSLTNSSGTSDTLGVTLQADLAANDNTKINFTAATVTGFEILNLQAKSGIKTAIAAFSGGVADKVSFAAAANLKTVTITGNSDVEVDLANATAVTKLDVSGLTGGVVGADIKLAANTGALTVTGSNGTDYIQMAAVGTNGTTLISAGSGDDQITGAIANIAAQTVDGGAGTDTLTISDTALGTVSDNSFANITNFEKLILSDTGATNLTTGGFFNSAFANGVTLTATSLGDAIETIDLTTYGKAATMTVTSAMTTATNQLSVVGGAGADTITVTQTGVAPNAGKLAVSGGAGNDTITVSHVATAVNGGVVINGGTGADTITSTGTGARSTNNLVTFTESGVNDSTVAAYDKISGFFTADGTNYSDKLDVFGTATVAGNVASATASGIANVTYTMTSGIITFAGSGASSMSLADKITAVQNINSTDTATVAFVDSGNTYIYNYSSTSGGTSLIDLVGVSAAALSATATTATNGTVYVI